MGFTDVVQITEYPTEKDGELVKHERFDKLIYHPTAQNELLDPIQTSHSVSYLHTRQELSRGLGYVHGLDKKSIAIVESDTLMAEALTEVIEETADNRYKIETFTCPKEFKKRMKKGGIRIVLMDDELCLSRECELEKVISEILVDIPASQQLRVPALGILSWHPERYRGRTDAVIPIKKYEFPQIQEMIRRIKPYKHFN